MPLRDLLRYKSAIRPWVHEDFFDAIESESLVFPLSILQNKKSLDSIMSTLVRKFDTCETVCFLSFLNMMSQTQEINDIQKISRKELINVNMVPKYKRDEGEILLFQQVTLKKC